MKQIKLIILIAVFFYKPAAGFSQTLNWGNFKKNQQHIFNVNAGIEHGLIFGVGYGHQLKSKLPVVLNAEYSFPSGRKLFDDFKTKIGGQVRVYQTGNFHFSAKAYSVFRRYESDFVRLLNFGTEMSVIIGYYKLKWFVAGEAGFDKAIITHFKHTQSYKEIYPLVKDGWYEPATGGNFYYGLQAGYSFHKNDIYLKAGKIVSQDFQSDPVIPFSVQIGFNLKLTTKK
jgi:hypothetical protein